MRAIARIDARLGAASRKVIAEAGDGTDDGHRRLAGVFELDGPVAGAGGNGRAADVRRSARGSLALSEAKGRVRGILALTEGRHCS